MIQGTERGPWPWPLLPQATCSGGVLRPARARSVLGVDRHTLCVPVDEQVQDFAGLGVATLPGFRIHEIAIDRDVEDSLRARDQLEGTDDVLIAGHDVVGRAHGAGEIVSGDAVRDFYVMHGLFTLAVKA